MKKAMVDQLKKLMKQKQISAYRLAKLTGLHQITIWRLLHGKTTPQLQTLERIARVLGVKVSELIEKE